MGHGRETQLQYMSHLHACETQRQAHRAHRFDPLYTRSRNVAELYETPDQIQMSFDELPVLVIEE